MNFQIGKEDGAGNSGGVIAWVNVSRRERVLLGQCQQGNVPKRGRNASSGLLRVNLVVRGKVRLEVLEEVGNLILNNCCSCESPICCG